MSTTPLSSTQERIERSIFERIRIELIDKGYLPDIDAAPYNTGDAAGQNAWDAQMTVIATAKKFAIELIGAGSYDKSDEKKVPRIVVQAGEFIEGELGGDQQRSFQLNDAQSAFDVIRRPAAFSDYYTNVHVIANTTEQLRIVQAVLSLAMQTKGYLPLYDIDPRVIQPSGNFFYRKTGAGSLPQPDEGVIEKVYSYVITDVLEQDCPTESDGAPLISQIDFDQGTTVTAFTDPFPECPPATMTFNTILYGDLPAGVTTNIIIKDTNGDVQGYLVGDTIYVPAGVGAGFQLTINGSPVLLITGPTGMEVVDANDNQLGSWNGTKWVVPLSTVAFDRPQNVETTIYAIYDAAWRQANGEIPSLSATEFLQELDPTDPLKIKYDDSAVTGIVEHLFRFVGINGGYPTINPADPLGLKLWFDKDGVASDETTVMTKDGSFMMIDRLTGIAMSYNNWIVSGGGQSPVDFYTNMWLTDTFNGYTGGWFALSVEEVYKITLNGFYKADWNAIWRDADWWNMPGTNLLSTAYLGSPTINIVSFQTQTYSLATWSRANTTATGRYYQPCRTFDEWPLY